MTLGIALFAALLAAPPAAPAAATLWTDQNIPPEVLARLTEGQDLALGQRYDEAEARIREAQALAPEHPLAGVFLVSTLLSKVQEQMKDGRKDVPPEFFKEIDRVVGQAEAQAKAFPQSPYPKLYLGAAYGVRGLAKLYAGSYLASYFDGKKGAALLKEAVAIDPTLYNAYMGLGQFEYYCGTLSGVLQFVLALPGDPDKGLAMLKECEDKASYAAWPCKVYRISLMLSDRHDYKGAEPELAALMARYPGNYQFARSVFEVLAAGINTAALRRSAEDVLRRLDQGWEPPKHADIDPDGCRLTLAKAYLQADQAALAVPHLRRLAAHGHGDAKDQAQALLLSLPPEALAAPPSLTDSAQARPLSPAASPAGCPACPPCTNCP
jgi:tetratricopeptide (TPR) repeat protein